MPNLRPLYPAIRLAVACLILAIGLRTWLVMGVIEPVGVSGSSMVPSLYGTYVTPRCPGCEHEFRVGVEFAVDVEQMTCPSCASTEVPLAGLALRRGDRIWVDRMSLRWREPQRWETVVVRNPHNGTELCVKRVVGLPGERVDLLDGDVRIDGAVHVKSRHEQHLVRQLVHRESRASRRWQPQEPSRWKQSGDSWHHAANDQASLSWLRYRHLAGGPITDDVTYNAGLTRRLNLVDEFMLSFETELRGRGSIQLALDDGKATAKLRIQLPGCEVEMTEDGHTTGKLQLSAALANRWSGKLVTVELSNFDQQLLLVVDDEVVLRRGWPGGKAPGTAEPVAIGVQGLDATLKSLTLYRDIYHSSHPVNSAGPSAERWQLGPGEFFLLGDNPPVSVDSRLWGPVPARLFVGKPL